MFVGVLPEACRVCERQFRQSYIQSLCLSSIFIYLSLLLYETDVRNWHLPGFYVRVFIDFRSRLSDGTSLPYPGCSWTRCRVEYTRAYPPLCSVPPYVLYFTHSPFHSLRVCAYVYASRFLRCACWIVNISTFAHQRPDALYSPDTATLQQPSTFFVPPCVSPYSPSHTLTCSLTSITCLFKVPASLGRHV